MDVQRRSLGSVKFRTHVVATTECATGSVHTPRVARTFFGHISLRDVHAYTHGSWCLQCACHISPSHSLAIFALPALSLRCHVPDCTIICRTVHRSENAGRSALPHERRGQRTPQTVGQFIRKLFGGHSNCGASTPWNLADLCES